MISTEAIDIINTIAAMHLQEQKIRHCVHYFDGVNSVDESCRSTMIDWLCQISDALSLNRETIYHSMSLLDRFLSSCTNSSDQALASKEKFQLAAITAYYIAVKINEPVELSLDMLVKLCRGCYDKSAILKMEQNILFSLEWRISAPTPLDFMRQILALLPSTDERIVEAAEQHLAESIKNSYFSTVAPSILGAACVVKSFKESNARVPAEHVQFWSKICKMLDLSTSPDFIEVQRRLHAHSSTCVGQFATSGRTITTLPKGSSSYVSCGESSSPVSINVTT